MREPELGTFLGDQELPIDLADLDEHELASVRAGAGSADTTTIVAVLKV